MKGIREERDEESLKVFINQVNPKTKFTAEYSKEEVKILDLNKKIIEVKLNTDWFVKPSDTH